MELFEEETCNEIDYYEDEYSENYGNGSTYRQTTERSGEMSSDTMMLDSRQQ
jgi:hypothetical protein